MVTDVLPGLSHLELYFSAPGNPHAQVYSPEEFKGTLHLSRIRVIDLSEGTDLVPAYTILLDVSQDILFHGPIVVSSRLRVIARNGLIQVQDGLIWKGDRKTRGVC